MKTVESNHFYILRLKMNRSTTENNPQYDLQPLRPQPYHSDEIDLGQLLVNIFEQWKLIGFVAALCLTLGLLFAITRPNVYAVSADIALPSQSALGPLLDQTLINISRQGAFNTYVDTLMSADIQAEAAELSAAFIDKNSLETEFVNYASLVDGLNMARAADPFEEQNSNEDQDNNVTNISLTFKTDEPDKGVIFLNTLLSFVSETAIKELENNAQTVKAERKLNIETKLNDLTSARETIREAAITRLEEANDKKRAVLQLTIDLRLKKAEVDRVNRLVILKEALSIADELSISEPITWETLRTRPESAQILNTLSSERESQPLYFNGTRLLNAEITKLTNRTDIAPFVGGISDLEMQIEQINKDPELAALKQRTNDTIYLDNFDETQNQLTTLNSERTTFENASLMRITRQPTVPTSPISPNRKLIVVAALVLGLFAGLFIALIRIAMNSSKERHKAQLLTSDV